MRTKLQQKKAQAKALCIRTTRNAKRKAHNLYEWVLHHPRGWKFQRMLMRRAQK